MLIALAVGISVLPALADSTEVAISLGNVIGSEKVCDLTYDQEAIAAYIEKTVPADDMEFPGMLRMFIDGAEREGRSMSESEKTAFCTQIRRVAKANGFISE